MKILFAVDGSPQSLAALESLVAKFGYFRETPLLTLLHVHLPVPYKAAAKWVGKETIQRYYDEESDAALLEEMMQEALKAYQQIINSNAGTTPAADDFVKMQAARKKIVEWMLTEDYGVKVARQNNIPVEVIEAYGFPPPEHS